MNRETFNALAKIELCLNEINNYVSCETDAQIALDQTYEVLKELGLYDQYEKNYAAGRPANKHLEEK